MSEKVWVVRDGTSYLLEVYSSEEKAEKRAKELSKNAWSKVELDECEVK